MSAVSGIPEWPRYPRGLRSAPRAQRDRFTRRIIHLSTGRRSRGDGTARALVEATSTAARSSRPCLVHRPVRSNSHGPFTHRGSPAPRDSAGCSSKLRAARARPAAGVPHLAEASFLSPEAEDALAGFIAMVVIFVVPVVLITVFWLVHILPEQIAHKRHHPQFEAIRTSACCRWSSVGCWAASPGSGPTRSRSCTRWPTALTSTPMPKVTRRTRTRRATTRRCGEAP